MFRPGDEVFAYCRRHHLQFGTYGEYTSVPDAFVAHKPESLSWEEAAALPLCGLTAHQALETLGVRGGEKLLVTRRRRRRRPRRDRSSRSAAAPR